MYGYELEHVFQAIENRLMEIMLQKNNEEIEQATWSLDTRESEVKLCLKYFYYWINYSPLSRGSAAVGYASLVGCVLAMGDVLMSPLPEGIQLDWEAMFEPDPHVFVDRVYPWMGDRRPAYEVLPPKCYGHNQDCSVEEILPTARAVLYAINEFYL